MAVLTVLTWNFLPLLTSLAVHPSQHRGGFLVIVLAEEHADARW
jgi:hypothetical protein